jgi:hypothetical protein
MSRALFALLLCGCSGTTGSSLVTFSAVAGGPSDAPGGQLEFDTGSGYHLVLTQSTLHLGAVYLNMSVPTSGGPEEPCILPGIYVGQAYANLDLDLLSPTTVPFAGVGEGTANPAVVGEVWLTGSDINASDDPTPILQAAGTASRNGMQWPFTAAVTIGSNRQIPATNPAMPGANPICRQRIVSPIRIDLTLSHGGTLYLRIDPRGMWNGVDFASLPPSTGTYVIPDEQGGVGGQLFKGVVAAGGVYQFSFTPKGGL